MIAGASEAGGDENRADLVAVETCRVGFVVEAWAAEVHGWQHRVMAIRRWQHGNDYRRVRADVGS